jgi:hypothetical protein
MLKKLRHKKTAKKVWIILALIIIPAFVLWGAGSVTRSKQETGFAGKIFGRKISKIEFNEALSAVKNQAIMQFGDNFSQIQKQLNLEAEAWERIMLLQEAGKRKITVGDREVVALIKSYPFFQRKGNFDNNIYSQMLQYVFHTQARVFEEQTRQNLALVKLYNIITKDVAVSDAQIKDGYLKENEDISIYYIGALFTDMAGEISPSEEELKSYFLENSLQFKQPLSFNLEYAILASEDNIKRVSQRLRKEKDFTKLAKEFNLSIKETGLFRQTDPIPGLGWSPQVLSLINKLKIGDFSPVLYIDQNWYILRVKERKEPYIPQLETIKEKVKESFIRDKSQGLAKEKIQNCLKKLKEVYKDNCPPQDLQNLAKEFGLKSGVTGNFKYASYIEGIGVSDEFWAKGRSLKENEYSELINAPSGVYIIELKSKTNIDEKKFEAEKTEFSKRLLLQKKQEYFLKFVQDLKTKTELF